jgi:phage recombination protein Bet
VEAEIADRGKQLTKEEEKMGAEIVSAKKPSLLEKMADEYSLDTLKFWEGIKATIAPTKKDGALASDAEIMTFLMVANQYKLNPFLREIHGFVGKGGKVQVIVGIDGWIKMVNRRADYGGFDMLHKLDEKGNLASITCRMKVKDDSVALGVRIVEMTEYMSECKMPGKEPWEKWPARMLHHKAFIQAARYAFGITEFIDEDEGERYATEIDVTPGKSAFSPPQQKKEESAGTMAEERRPTEHAAVPAAEAAPAQAATATADATKAPAEAPDKLSEQQMKKIQVCLKEIGCQNDQEKHEYVSNVLLKNPIISSINDLTKREASTLIESLVKAIAQGAKK